MTQILVRGESVYKCDVCSRKLRVLTSREGIDVVQRCTITFGCKGKLHRVTSAEEVNSTPAFPEEVPGVQDWFQRRVVFTQQQPIKAQRWVVNHNLSNRPLVYAYTSRQTEASPTHSATNVPAGTIWYKSASGLDPNNPTAPTAAGLYEYNGTKWVVPKNVMSVGNMGNNVHEYLVLTPPKEVVTVNQNTVEIVFDIPYSGLVQCVALASQNTSNPTTQRKAVGGVPFKLSNDGEITIATLDSTPFITVPVNFKSAIVANGIAVTFNNIDNTASVASPWVGTEKVFINGRTYTVRSFNLARLSPVPTIMASGNVDPSRAPFSFEHTNAVINENLILIGLPPYSTVDRVMDKYVDMAMINKFNPEIYYSNGEVYIDSSLVRSVYPEIHIVD